MSTKYTLAHVNNMLIAIVPDGEDIAAAVKAVSDEIAKTGDGEISDYEIETGLTLTDYPEETDKIFWNGVSGNGGWLMVKTDGKTTTYDYAVHQA